MKPFTDIARLSLNQITTQRWSVREAVDGCVRAGIPFIGLWREKVADEEEVVHAFKSSLSSAVTI